MGMKAMGQGGGRDNNAGQTVCGPQSREAERSLLFQVFVEYCTFLYNNMVITKLFLRTKLAQGEITIRTEDMDMSLLLLENHTHFSGKKNFIFQEFNFARQIIINIHQPC